MSNKLSTPEAIDLFLEDIEAGRVPRIYGMVSAITDVHEVWSLIDLAAQMQAATHTIPPDVKQRLDARLFGR